MKVAVNGINLNVEVQGGGRPVLLLHGFPDSSKLWRNQIAFLAERGFKVIVPDLRGFGDSDRPEGVENYHILNSIQDLQELLDRLDVAEAHVVGHDFGAATAWVFASLFPARTSSLTALSVGHPAELRKAGLEQLSRSWYMFLFQFEGVAEDFVRQNDWAFARQWLGGSEETARYISDLSRPGALTAALNWYRANIPPRSWISGPPDLPQVTVPAMGIWSTGDFALTERQMTESESHVSGPWRYERVEGAGHWIPLDAPDRLNELLLSFFG
jgi:pimeloyl-ACP methyl ester carboxylesterase